MGLPDWLAEGKVLAPQSSPQEIAELPGSADRDLADCQAPGHSSDWRLAIAHSAVLLSATAALAASGYRASRQSHHYHVIQSLLHTIGASPGTVNRLHRLGKKRHLASYERAGLVSGQEADEAVAMARELRQQVGQ